MSNLVKIKKARVFKGAGYTDGSHPERGNLVLMNGGEAFFGGVLYRRQHAISTAMTPPSTHVHPEGLYQHPDNEEYKVYVQHEPEPCRYRITYLSTETTDGSPFVNRGIIGDVVSFYTLVAPA